MFIFSYIHNQSEGQTEYSRHGLIRTKCAANTHHRAVNLEHRNSAQVNSSYSMRIAFQNGKAATQSGELRVAAWLL